jgi:palmitoyltransferase ZDHHC9/14/18
MGIRKQQSSNQTQEQTAFTTFQPSFLDTNLVSKTPKDYDFEKASNPNPTNAIAESELIPHWSGVTSHSAGIISYASSTPILNHKQKTQSKIIIEKQDLQSIQTRQIVFKERTVKNYQIFPGNTRFLCGGRFVTSKDYRGFLAALLLFITPVILFFIFT